MNLHFLNKPQKRNMENDSSVSESEHLLQRWQAGDLTALEQLLERHYHSKFIPLAKAMLHGERYRHLLPASDLVHQTYFKLRGLTRLNLSGMSHFWRVVGAQMKKVITDFVRVEEAEFRGGKDKHKNEINLHAFEEQ